MLIRQESRSDFRAIRALNEACFGGVEESRLIDSLRDGGEGVLSLVAEDDGELIGHIFFSRIWLSPPGAAANEREGMVALAPVCVSSVHQKKGVGGALIRQGLRILRQRGEKGVFVMGHSGYYPKFGFSAELAAAFTSDYSGESFFATELVAGGLTGKSGTLRYPEAFQRLS